MFRYYPLTSHRFGLEMREAVVQISTHSSSLLSDMPPSAALLLPADGADKLTGTAEISAFIKKKNTVLEHMSLV